MKTLVVAAIVVAGALVCGAGQEPEGRIEAPQAPLDEWEQLAKVSMNIGDVTTWYVDDDSCPAPGSGTAADPFCLIQDCIAAADDGDECVVAPGTYFETINFLGKAITLHSSKGPEATVIDGNLNGSVVTFDHMEGPASLLRGFTVRNGLADYGAGIRIYSGPLTSPTIDDCVITANTALGEAGGGGIFCSISNARILHCTIISNTAVDKGGGISCGVGNAVVSDCTIASNSAQYGGGIFSSGNTTVSGCTIAGNVASGAGGGMNNILNNPTLLNCMFIRNEAASTGGGMNNILNNPTLLNCMFIRNEAASTGGGMYNIDSNPTVTNCTFSGNEADNGRALAFDSFKQRQPSDLSMTNCILWDGGDEVWNNDNSMISIAYSDVQVGWPGDGNIDADPLFIDSANGDFRLSADSPCIDAADNTAVPEGIVSDLDGNPRFVDDPNMDDTGLGEPPIVDMGAYEFRDPCADDDGDGRVTICHVPPGNRDNAHTITVSANAIPAHLAHGDYCGPCENERSAEADRKAPSEERKGTVGPSNVLSP